MNITKEQLGPCRWKVVVEVPAGVIQSEHENVLNALMQEAEVDGFRTGRAPRALVEAKYAKFILDELKTNVLRQAYQAARTQEKLDVVNIVDLEVPAILLGQPARFVFTVDVAPEFKLPSYRDIPVKSRPPKVEAEEVEAVKKDFLRDLERWDKVEGRPVQPGDLVVVDYEGVCEGKPILELGVKLPLLEKAKDLPVLADETPWMPGLGKALVGCQVGDKREVWVEFPSHFEDAVLAGKKCTYFVEVKAIREKKITAPDENFYARYGVKTDAELEEKISDGLRKSKQDRDRVEQKNQIYEYLLRSAEMELPESEVNEEVERVVREHIENLVAHGRQARLTEQERDEVVKRATATGMTRVKLRHILRRIAQAENISVKPEEVQRAIASIVVSQGGTTKDADKLARKPDAYEKVEEMVRGKKVSDLLLSQAKVEVVSEEESKP